jgi:hypothetical protein
MLEPDELKELAADIAKNGLLNPVVLLEDQVLDGRNRMLACKLAGVTPEFTEWEQNGVSPVAWVIAQNLRRRHLTAGQRAAVAVEAKPLFDAEIKNGRPTKNSPKNGRVSGWKERIVADQFDVSHGYVGAAQQIKDRDELLFQELKAGRLSLPEAQRELGLMQKATKVMVSSECNEWYTPPKYLKAAREVIGDFDLDPASCRVANKVVKAKEYFTREQNGLSRTWHGSVWLNPPYGDVCPKFVARLVKAYESGEVAQAVLLVNSHSTDNKWFQPLFSYVLCFTDHRPKFWSDKGESNSPSHGSVFVYFGKRPGKFISVFSQFGAVVKRCV